MSPSNGTLVMSVAVVLLEDAADHHRAAVFDQHLGLHVLGVDREARRRCAPDAVLVDVDVRITLPSGVICGVTSSLQVRLAERDRGGAAAGRLLVREFRALLDQRLRPGRR